MASESHTRPATEAKRGGVRTFAVIVTSVLLGMMLPAPTYAAPSGMVHGAVASHVYWPADADLRNGGVFSTAQVDNRVDSKSAWGPSTLSGLGAAVIGTEATPTEPITLTGLDGTWDRASLLGVSANSRNNGLDGMWLITDSSGGGVNAVATPSRSTNPDFIERFGDINSTAIKWAPATNDGTGVKGNTYWVELPWPTGFSRTTCGIEVNPGTNEIVIMNACEPYADTDYAIYGPGDDGDPLTLADNTFRTLSGTRDLTMERPCVSDMTTDVAGNIYSLCGNGSRIDELFLYRTDGQIGEVSLISRGTADPALTYRAGAPVNDTDIGAYHSGLGFVDGKIAITSEHYANVGQYLPALDPLADTVSRVTGFPYGIQTSGPTKVQLRVDYDGAGIEGAVLLEGTVRDTDGAGVPGQTVGVYREADDGTAVLVGSATTDAAGGYQTLLNWADGVGYVRVVQPQRNTGGELKNGEVVEVEPFTMHNDGSNEVSALNEVNYRANPPLGTVGVTSIDIASTPDLAKVTGKNALVQYHADFTVEFGGSTADLSPNSLLTATAAGNGPQHVSVEGDTSGDLRIGASNGVHVTGATDDSHANDDGVFLDLAGEQSTVNGQLIAQGKDYTLRVRSEGAHADEAKVSVWATAPQTSSTAIPRPQFGGRMSGDGADVLLDYRAPASNGFVTVRANSSLSQMQLPDNRSGEYAALPGNGATPWVTAGEVEDHNLQIVDAIARIAVDSPIPGSYQYSLSNVSATAPSSTTASATVGDEGGRVAARQVASITTAGSDVIVTAGAHPEGSTLHRATVTDSVTGDKIADAVVSGDRITIPASAVPKGADVRLVLDYLERTVLITGTKIVAPVAGDLRAGTTPEPDNWEITLTSGQTTQVINGQDAVRLDREVTYTIGERLRTAPAPAANAPLYSQKGSLVCVDALGDALPEGVFDEEAQTLTVGASDAIPAPIDCSLTNQSAHIGLFVTQVGGATTAPADGWSLDGDHSDDSFDFRLDATSIAREALPGGYSLSASAPDGLALVGVQRLDLTGAECEAAVADPANAAESCWKDVEDTDSSTVQQGVQNIFRIVAASPSDMPVLPMTGGVASWIFGAAAAGVLVAAAVTYMIRRRALESAGISDTLLTE